MQIEISGHHVEVTPALSALIHKKLDHLSHKCPEGTHVRVILSVNKHTLHTAEATIHLPKTELHATAETHDMYESIHDLMHKLEVQVTKWKETQ